MRSTGSGSAALLALTLGLLSCDRSRDAAELRTDSADSVAASSAPDLAHVPASQHQLSIVAEELPLEPIYGQIAAVQVAGPHLWVMDLASAAPWLHILDTTTGRLIKSLGRIGEGPGEFRSVTNIFTSTPDDPAIWAWDGREGRVTKVVGNATGPVGNLKVEIVKPAVSGLGWVSPLGRAHFLGRRMHDLNEHFFVFSKEGTVLRVDSLHVPFRDSVPARAGREAINGYSLCSQRDRGGFAIAYPYAGRIQLYDSLAHLRGTAEVPVPGEENFVRDQASGQIRFEPGKLFYRGCSYSQDRLYALFIGISPKKGDNPWFGREIHVFDLGGKLLGTMISDVNLSGIAADSSGGRIFAVSFDTGKLYKFTVPLFKQP